jgi:hypothetical protein
MRTLPLLAAAAALALGGCLSEVTQRDGGVATYDAIKAAEKACEAKGKVFRLKHNGNAQYLEDYQCQTEKN